VAAGGRGGFEVGGELTNHVYAPRAEGWLRVEHPHDHQLVRHKGVKRTPNLLQNPTQPIYLTLDCVALLLTLCCITTKATLCPHITPSCLYLPFKPTNCTRKARANHHLGVTSTTQATGWEMNTCLNPCSGEQACKAHAPCTSLFLVPADSAGLAAAQTASPSPCSSSGCSARGTARCHPAGLLRQPRNVIIHGHVHALFVYVYAMDTCFLLDMRSHVLCGLHVLAPPAPGPSHHVLNAQLLNHTFGVIQDPFRPAQSQPARLLSSKGPPVHQSSLK
jgi:hypothetical protein